MTRLPLFLSKERSLDKVAAAKLSKNPDEWETEIIEMLHEQHPYITDSRIAVTLKKTDAETGTAIGQILVDDKAAIPVIVRGFKLLPMDVFYCDNELHALKRESLESKIQKPEIGKAVKPNTGAMSDVSIHNSTQAPAEGKYSFASDLSYTDAEISAALSNGLSDAGITYEMHTNPIFHDAVLVLTKNAGKTFEKEASVEAPRTITPRKDTFAKAASTGIFEVVTTAGYETGILFKELIPLAADSLTPRTGSSLFVSLDKTAYALTADPIGVREPTGPVTLPESELAGTGIFWTIKEGGLAVATEPVTVLWTSDNRCGLRTAMGYDVVAEISPKFSSIEKIGSTLYMNPSWVFTKIGHKTNISPANAANDYAWLCSQTWPEQIKTASAPLRVPELSKLELAAFVKVAAMFTPAICEHTKLSEEKTKETVDTLLNLNFLNSQNISRFVEHIDKLAEAKQAVAELLLATKLGLDLDSMPLRTALFALDQVEQDLKELRNSSSSK
jgi:hypothetical protein